MNAIKLRMIRKTLDTICNHGKEMSMTYFTITIWHEALTQA